MTQGSYLELVGGPGFEPGASRSRTVSIACPQGSRRLRRCPPGLKLPLDGVRPCPSRAAWYREPVPRLCPGGPARCRPSGSRIRPISEVGGQCGPRHRCLPAVERCQSPGPRSHRWQQAQSESHTVPMAPPCVWTLLRNARTAATRRWTSGSSARPIFEKIEVTYFSTAESER